MHRLPLSAKAYIAAVVAIGSCLFVLLPEDRQLPNDRNGLIVLGVAMLLAALSQIFKVEGSTEKTSYNLGLAIFGFSLLVLGPAAAILVAVFASLVEWIWHRYPWYIQTFNIFCLVINLSAAEVVYRWCAGADRHLSGGQILGTVAATVCFVLLNHLMVGLAISLARREPLNRSGVLAKMSLLIDMTLFAIGSVAALLWFINPYSALLLLIPLYMLAATLRVPSLQQQAARDAKTGLFNARYFENAAEKELARANRFNRPMTVVMGDLDLLRNINNTFGHLAGDQVLIGIANTMTEWLREDDLAARFGGEEFSILMPETSLAEARDRVEQLRQTIENQLFEVPSREQPIRATMSFGIAERAGQSQQLKSLIHQADLALYRAKTEGRNRVRAASDGNLTEDAEPHDQPTCSATSVPFKSSFPLCLENPAAQDASASAADMKEPVNRKTGTPQTGAPNGSASANTGAASTNRPPWQRRVFLGAVACVAAAGLGGTFAALSDSLLAERWYDLAVLVVIVATAEWLAIDIYARDASVSTSGAPFVAGAILFGPVGVVVLSAVLAGSAMIKHRSRLNRFVFNMSSHVIAGLAVTWMTVLALRAGIATSAWMQLALAVLGAIVLFAVTSLLVSAIVSIGSASSITRTWQERFQWLVPHYLGIGALTGGLVIGYRFAGYVGALIVLVPLLVLRYAQLQYVARTQDMMSSLQDSNRLLEERGAEISRLSEDLLLLVSNIADLRDPFMIGHSRYVSRYAVLVAEELGLDDATVERVRKAALLHDIGKLGINENILHRPGPLLENEVEQLRSHAVLGRDILADCHSLSALADIVRHHHENYDGSGYPTGLSGESIPVESRIIRVADTAEAMASDRPYRDALSLDAIFAELESGAGTRYDAVVVGALQRVIERQGQTIILNSADEVALRTGLAASRVTSGQPQARESAPCPGPTAAPLVTDCMMM